MKLHKILLTASILLGGLCASAQEEVVEYDFNPHFFGQVQVGGQETLGEGAFGKLLSPNAQLAVGYQFSPVFGLRVAVNGWQSRGVYKYTDKVNPVYNVNEKWKWNYIAPTLDAMFNLTNLFGGYNPTRLVDVNLYAGIGFNSAFNNKEAQAVNAKINGQYGLPNTNYPEWGENALGNIWGHGHTRLVGQFGADVNFNVTDRLQLGLEVMANVLNDHYNSRKADNADWYFNALIGVKYAFGPRYSTRTRVIETAPCEPQIIEKVVEKIVEVPVQVVEQKKEVQSFRRDVFFKINMSVITPAEMTKVEAVAEYLKAHPDAKVTVTGYADKGTGTKQYNLRLSAKRAEVVAKTLQTKYGISASRIMVKSMGDDEFQPYPDPVQNRVAICVAE
ncbi:MAG: OmpA family protein [Muribaculaceae bacterium]|nr:OmpA family protein [Muribaculaceae bacterium]